MTGNMLSIRKKGSHIYHQELAEKYGPIFKVRLAVSASSVTGQQPAETVRAWSSALLALFSSRRASILDTTIYIYPAVRLCKRLC